MKGDHFILQTKSDQTDAPLYYYLSLNLPIYQLFGLFCSIKQWKWPSHFRRAQGDVYILFFTITPEKNSKIHNQEIVAKERF